MLTRRHFLQFSALTAAGYAMAAEPILAQAIRTDTVGLAAGKEGFYAIAPEMFQREGGVTHLTDVREILKIVLNVPRKQILQDLSATANYARRQSAAQPERVGVTGFCWGGSTTIQYAAYDKDLGSAVAWYGPPGREYKDDPRPVPQTRDTPFTPMIARVIGPKRRSKVGRGALGG